MRSAVLEDCALCQETISSSELAAKARDGQFEGQKTHRHTHSVEISACSFPQLFFFRWGHVCSVLTASCWLFVDPPDWVPDEACNSCIACKAPFTVIRRKHHCRSCGKVRLLSSCWRVAEYSQFVLQKQMVSPLHVTIIQRWTNVYDVLADLLLSLLLPLCTVAPIRPGEARQGVHTLLHVPCHTFLQRQGRHLTPDHHTKHTVHHNKIICNRPTRGCVQSKCHAVLVNLKWSSSFLLSKASE